MNYRSLLTVGLFFIALGTAHAGDSRSSPGAAVYFVNVQDGDQISSPLKIIFGLAGMGIAPSGIEKDFTGHHHLLIDRPPLGEGEDGAEELDLAIAADANHVHFGKGQTEASIELPAGAHTLQLVLGDWAHVPHTRPLASDVITIHVE